MEELKKNIINKCNTTISIGLSNEFKLIDIDIAYLETKKAIKNKTYSGNNSINIFKEKDNAKDNTKTR